MKNKVAHVLAYILHQDLRKANKGLDKQILNNFFLHRCQENAIRTVLSGSSLLLLLHEEHFMLLWNSPLRKVNILEQD